MDEKLLRKYLEYANTPEAFAVLFVKKHLDQAKGHWIDIVDCEQYEMSSDNLHFRFVKGGLYKRKMRPRYPSKAAYTTAKSFDERGYNSMIRAITWKTAHEDIEQQKASKVAASKFKITGVSFDKNRGSRNFFRDNAPPEIKSLAKNLSDRTDPLWDEAEQYISEPEFVYKIKSISFN